MAQPRDFNGRNHVLAPPEGMEEFVKPLPVFAAPNQLISCWMLSDEEKAEVARTGNIWISVLGGKHPPISVSGAPLISQNSPDGTPIPYDVDAPTAPPQPQSETEQQ